MLTQARQCPGFSPPKQHTIERHSRKPDPELHGRGEPAALYHSTPVTESRAAGELLLADGPCKLTDK